LLKKLSGNLSGSRFFFAAMLYNGMGYKEEIMKKVVWLVIFILILSACSQGNNAANLPQQTEAVPADTGVIETPTVIENSSITPTPVPELGEGELPVILSYIEETDGERNIISTALNFQADYSAIPVERGTDFRGQAAVDSDLNLYLLYGSRINYFSKLSIDGKIETIEIPYNWTMETGWVGHQLFVMANAHSMSVINTDLEITTLSPALNDLEDGIYRGSLRTTKASSPTVIWTFMEPVEDETGDYALYRTLSLDTLTTSEYKLKIPDSDSGGNSQYYPTHDPNQRRGTLVYTIDIQNENVFLCYGDSKENELGGTSVHYWLELYASKIGETAATGDFPCLNRVFDLRGNSIISMSNPVSGGETWVLGLNDLQPIFDITEYFDMDNYYDNWISSNGVYWQIISQDEITVIYSDLQNDASYPFPYELPTDLIPGTTLVPVFLIND
jgi:hypothetical protein